MTRRRPFSTAFLANYGDARLAELFFSGNLMILGLILLVNWIYATAGHRLVKPDLEREVIVNGVRRGILLPAVALISIVISVFYPRGGSLIYLIIPILLVTPRFRQR
jgi:uncharacterized membrane protein